MFCGWIMIYHTEKKRARYKKRGHKLHSHSARFVQVHFFRFYISLLHTHRHHSRTHMERCKQTESAEKNPSRINKRTKQTLVVGYGRTWRWALDKHILRCTTSCSRKSNFNQFNTLHNYVENLLRATCFIVQQTTWALNCIELLQWTLFLFCGFIENDWILDYDHYLMLLKCV